MDEAIFYTFPKYTRNLIWSEQTGLHESAKNKYFAKNSFGEEFLDLLFEQ